MFGNNDGGSAGYIIGRQNNCADKKYETIAEFIRNMSNEDLATLCTDLYSLGYRESRPKDRLDVYHEFLHWLQSSPII